MRGSEFTERMMVRGQKCPYCGFAMLGGNSRPTRDHINPKSKGHDLNGGNKVFVCYSCNMEKGARSLQEFYEDCKARMNQRMKYIENFMLDRGIGNPRK
jgi:hypothetical protein